jgi:hypothetical protein
MSLNFLPASFTVGVGLGEEIGGLRVLRKRCLDRLVVVWGDGC